MIVKKITHLVDLLEEREIVQKEDKELVVYGLLTGSKLVLNTITTILLGALFGLALESIFFLCAFSWIRTYAGGYHCQKAIHCYFFSSIIVAGTLGVVRFTPGEYYLGVGLAMLVVALPLLLKCAPIETVTKPFDDDEYRFFRKKMVTHLAIECVGVVVLYICNQLLFSYMICCGIALSAILVILQLIEVRRCKRGKCE